jgi:thiamine-phosphate pyrophosphorylase
VSPVPRLPRLYAIIDPSLLPAGVAAVAGFARELLAGGAAVLQLRGKNAEGAVLLSCGRELRRISTSATLVMNDRPDLCLAAGFDGVHLGQDDLSPDGARKVVGPDRWVGISTHRLAQVREAEESTADYVAIGPVFATGSKQNPDSIIGLRGVQEARRATRKPLVAIGGIKRGNCRDVIEAGADSVAVISDLVDSPRKSVEDFLRILE